MDELHKHELSDPLIVFHGTGTHFSAGIEQDGWCLGQHPFGLERLSRLRDLAKLMRIESVIASFAYGVFDINVGRIIEQRRGASFTPRIWKALIWAEMGIGETARNALELSRLVLAAGEVRPGLLDQESMLFVQGLFEELYRASIASRSALYVVRVGRDHFGEKFAIQYERWLDLDDHLKHQFWPLGKDAERFLCMDVLPESIIGRWTRDPA